MGITYTEGGLRKKRWRVAIQRHGQYITAYFLTQAQAQAFFDQWDKKLLRKYGPRSSRIGPEVDIVVREIMEKYRKAAAAQREKSERERNYLAPCGNITKAGNHAARTKNPRCPPGQTCQHYDDCLGVAARRNWPGWRVKLTS